MAENDSHQLAVTVHHNNEITVRDERGYPNLCRDCRYSGWLTQYERQNSPEPLTCLLRSGGADTLDGDRVIHDAVRQKFEDYGRGKTDHANTERRWRKHYPTCWSKNSDGNCEDYVKAKPLPWLGNFWRKLFSREWRTRKMRL